MGRAQFGNKLKVLPTTQVMSLPFTSFPVSTTVFLYSSVPVLNINAKKRRYDVNSTMDVGLTSCSIRPTVKTNGTLLGSGISFNGLSGSWSSFTLGASGWSIVSEVIALIGDYIAFVGIVGATAPTVGSITIYAQEVI